MCKKNVKVCNKRNSDGKYGEKSFESLTHSMPSINGVSGQSFSGNRCRILPLRFPDPKFDWKDASLISHNIYVLIEWIKWMIDMIHTFFFMIISNDNKIVG